jgi:sulfatase maturation enzyme AslB (radical SAM superfamily)
MSLIAAEQFQPLPRGMNSRIFFRNDLPDASGGLDGATATMIADLGFPCHLDCAPCRRQRPPTPREYLAVLQSLTEAAFECSRDRLRVVFHGGDVFARSAQFEKLLHILHATCASLAIELSAAVISDGVAWDAETVSRFFDLGVQHYQVSMDGPADYHELLRPLRGHGSSFASILRSLKYHRDRAGVIVRAEPGVGAENLAKLLDTLNDEGLLAGKNPIAVLVAPAAPYPREARELAQFLDVLQSRGKGVVLQ